VTTATGPAARETTPLWDALVGVVFPGLLLALVYELGGTWSIGQTFGGESDTGWIDFQGRPIDHPPLVADVVGHPAGWVFLVLVLLLAATALWVSRTGGRAARLRALVGVAVATAFVVAVILVFTVLQMRLVHEAFEQGSTHPTILGNATLTVAPQVEAG
jgi:hypothetical protein